jgi:hypothetical protein
MMMYLIATKEWYLLRFYIAQCLEAYGFEKRLESGQGE